ncbi:microtubule-associated protein futsch-like [Amphibalanus amphitrite]|nr:microtubule-associated protein futsch-like [Amphibalanus amphitrite]
MGRRRAGGGGDSLPQTVRRNNAKNERKTMEAMADTLWASVESGKERRLRLAAERMGRMLAGQETTLAPQEQQEPAPTQSDAASPVVSEQRSEAEEVTQQEKEDDNVTEQEKAAGASEPSEVDSDMVPVHVVPEAVPQTPTEQAANEVTEQRASEVAESVSAMPGAVTFQDEANDAATPHDAYKVQQEVQEVLQTAEKATEVEEIQEAALPDGVALAEAAVPTEQAEVPDQADDVCMSTWEVVDAPNLDRETVESIPLEPDEAVEIPQNQEANIPSAQVDTVSPSDQDILKNEPSKTKSAELATMSQEQHQESSIDENVDNPQDARNPLMMEGSSDGLASTECAPDAATEEVCEAVPVSEEISEEPVADIAESCVSEKEKEADLPSTSQSDMLAGTVTSPESPKAEQPADELGDGVTDAKKDKKKKKKGKHAVEASLQTTVQEPEDKPSTAGEHEPSAKSGKKHKRHRDKRKKSQSETEKEITVQENVNKVDACSDVTAQPVTDPSNYSEVTKTDEDGKNDEVTEPTIQEPVEDQWTTVETKKTKRRRKKSERKSESEDKEQAVNKQGSELAKEVEAESNTVIEDSHVHEATETTDGISQFEVNKKPQETAKDSLNEFERLLSSVGALKEKFRQASEAETEKPAISADKSIQDEQETTTGFSSVGQPEIAHLSQAKELSEDPSNDRQCSPANESTVTATQATADEIKQVECSHLAEKLKESVAESPDVFDLMRSTDEGLEAGFNEAFGSEDQAREELEEVRPDEQEQTIRPAETSQTPVLEKPSDAADLSTKDVPDAFDLLVSTGEDLESGFKDAFGDEDLKESDAKSSDTENKTKEDTSAENTITRTAKVGGLEKGHELEQEAKTVSSIELRETIELIDASTTKGDVKQDAFDLLLSTDDDLEEGFKDSFASEDVSSEQQQQANGLSQTPVALPESKADAQEPEDALQSIKQETRDAPDAFDVLMSAGDDLQAGFMDAFGEEDAFEGSLDKETMEQVETPVESPPANSSVKVDVCGSSLEAEEESKMEDDVVLKAKSTSETPVLEKPSDAANLSTKDAPDVFDLLVSTGEDLESGFKDSFGDEDLKESDAKSSDTENKTKEDTSAENTITRTAKKGANSLETEEESKTEDDVLKAQGTADAFDILLSTNGDLQEGFRKSFSLDEETTTEMQITETASTTDIVIPDPAKSDKEHPNDDNIAAISKDNTESQWTEAAKIHAGNLPEAAMETVAPMESSSAGQVSSIPSTVTEWFDKTSHDAAEAKYHEQMASKHAGSDDQEDGMVQEEMRVQSDQKSMETMETVPPVESSSAGEVPSIPSTVTEWFDKTSHDAAEAKYYEQMASKHAGSDGQEDGMATEEVRAESEHKPMETPSEPKEPSADVVVAPGLSHQSVAPTESTWYDKMLHDSAETDYYERLSRCKITNQGDLGERVPSTNEVTASTTLPVTIDDDSSATETKTEAMTSSNKGEDSAGELLPKQNVQFDENTWYDKVMHDEAEANHFARLAQTQQAESNAHDAQASSAKKATTEAAQPVLSSEQTWFDKPFHDSAETVHHARQSSNESDSSNKSYPLYEGKCDHFNPDDHQAPEESAEPSGEAEACNRWTESKLYQGADAPSISTEPVPEPTPITAQITVNTEGSTVSGEQPLSPTSDGSRSRRSTFNSAVSPLSPQTELDDYFEDVVLAGRQSDVTMAALRGFTASPLSEGLAPGEQLDSLRTEPDLELSEPGTADTLDDGPFSYQDIGDEGTVTPVGDDLGSTPVQTMMQDVRLSSEQLQTEAEEAGQSTTPQHLVGEKKETISLPVDAKDGVTSPLLDKGKGNAGMETVSIPNTTPIDIPSVPVEVTATEDASDNIAKDISVSAKDTDKVSTQVAEVIPESLTTEDSATSAELTSPIMASTPAKSDTHSQSVVQTSNSELPPNIAVTTPGTPLLASKENDSNSNESNESANMKERESPSKELNEKLGLNEDGTVPVKELDEEVIQFTEQGVPKSPVATKRCSRKKKMRSGGRKSSSESIETQQSSCDRQTPPAHEEPIRPAVETLDKDTPTKEGSSFPQPVAVAPTETQIIPCVPEQETADIANTTEAESTYTEEAKTEPSSTTQAHDEPVQDNLHKPLEENAVDASPKDSGVPSQAHPSYSETTTPPTIQPSCTDQITTELTETVFSPHETGPTTADKDVSSKSDTPTIVEDLQPKLAEKGNVEKPDTSTDTSQPDTAETESKITIEIESPDNLTETQRELVETQQPAQRKTEVDTTLNDVPIKLTEEPSVVYSLGAQLAGAPVFSVAPSWTQELQQMQTEMQTASDSPVQAAPASPIQAAPASSVQAAPASPEQAAPASPVQAAPASPVQVAPASPVQVAPASPVQAAPASPEHAAPASPVKEKSKLEDIAEAVVNVPEPESKPATAKTDPKTKLITSSLPNEAKAEDQKPAGKTPSNSRPILPDRTLFLPEDEGRTYASLMQQGADMLPARPVFTAHACHVCKRLHTKQHRLKSCGSCRLVAYCSAEHQRAHWPMHRALCKVITRRVRYLGTDHIYREALNVPSPEQWKKIRFKHMAVCEEMLGRPMEAYEKEMFLYPRACDTCHETNPEKLHTCANCHSVSFCSEDHLRKNHSKYCKDLRTLLDIHSYQNSHGVCEPPLPDTVLSEYEMLPPHIRELLVVSLLGPQRAMALGPVPLTVLTDYASYPLTLLFALQNIPVAEEVHISQRTELTVHVVGAEHATDCHPLGRWGSFLLHLLPRLRRLHVVFIGLELEAAGGRPGVTQHDFTSAACRAAGRRLTCELQPSTAYHTYCRSPQFRPPDVIAAFNAGLHRFAGHERRDTWRETIPYLVRDGVPLVLSGYTLLECPQDVARIEQEQKVDVLLPPRKNPYRSTRPQQNFLNEHEAPVVFKNQYVACLTAAAKPRK